MKAEVAGGHGGTPPDKRSASYKAQGPFGVASCSVEQQTNLYVAKLIMAYVCLTCPFSSGLTGPRVVQSSEVP